MDIFKRPTLILNCSIPIPIIISHLLGPGEWEWNKHNADGYIQIQKNVNGCNFDNEYNTMHFIKKYLSKKYVHDISEISGKEEENKIYKGCYCV